MRTFIRSKFCPSNSAWRTSTTFFNVSAGELKTGSFFREGDAATGTGGVDNPEGPAVGTGDCAKASGVKAKQDAARRMRVRSGVIFME